MEKNKVMRKLGMAAKSGERMPPAEVAEGNRGGWLAGPCWFWRPAETRFLEAIFCAPDVEFSTVCHALSGWRRPRRP
jgi:hypothetical protein